MQLFEKGKQLIVCFFKESPPGNRRIALDAFDDVLVRELGAAMRVGGSGQSPRFKLAAFVQLISQGCTFDGATDGGIGLLVVL